MSRTHLRDVFRQVPELCRGFYSLASYACELRVEALSHLSSAQLGYFGQLLRLGIFGSAANAFPTSATPLGFGLDAFSDMDNSVTHQCLEIITSVVDYCLTVRARTVSSAEYEIARHLVCNLGLDTRLLTDLFALITKDTYSVDLETVFSTAVLDLIHLDQVRIYQMKISAPHPIVIFGFHFTQLATDPLLCMIPLS